MFKSPNPPVSTVGSAAGQEYMDRMWAAKRARCTHSSIKRVSARKFYCPDCGRVFRYVPEEAALAAGLAVVGILTAIYLLSRGSSGK
jgi:hypothetical protein